jgi:MFS family permease
MGEQATWDGPDDPQNPRNWTRSQKLTVVMLISAFRTTTMMAGSFLAPALEDIADELKISSIQQTNIILSVYILAFAVGPLFLGPTSEVFGRAPVLHFSNVGFLLFNIAASFSKTSGQMTAFRFLGGIVGSAPMAVC